MEGGRDWKFAEQVDDDIDGGGEKGALVEVEDEVVQRVEEDGEGRSKRGGKGKEKVGSAESSYSCRGEWKCFALPKTGYGRPAAKIFHATSYVECAKHPMQYLKSGAHWARQCLFCSVFLSGSIKPTRNHVLKHCSKISPEERSQMRMYVEGRVLADGVESLRAKPIKEISVQGFVGTTLSKETQAEWYDDLARVVIIKNWPFDFFEDEDVQKSYLRLNPKLVFPSRKKIASRITAIDKDVQSSIRNALGEETNLTLILDGWTNIRGESLWAFTILTPSRQSYLVEVKDLSGIKQAGPKLQAAMKAVMDKWGGPHKFIAVLTDNASNCKSAREGLQKQLWEGKDDEGPPLKIWILALRCMPHAFNLMVGDFFKHHWADTRVKSCKKLFIHFSRSPMLNDALTEERKLLAAEKGKSIRGLSITDCTRWLSCHSMLESIVENIEPIARVFDQHMDEKVRPLRDSTVQDPNFASDVELLTGLLKPFTTATATMERRSATLASLSVHLFMLGRTLLHYYDAAQPSPTNPSNASNASRLDFLHHCCSCFLTRLEEFNGDLLSLAILLDPALRFVQSYSKSEKTFQSLRRCALRLYSRRICSLATPAAVAISGAMKDFVANRAPWNQPYKLGDSVSDWLDAIPDSVGTIGLKAIAKMLLAIVPDQLDTERRFSIRGYVNSRTENGVGAAMATCLVRSRLFYRQEKQQRRANPQNASPMDDVQTVDAEMLSVGETEPEIFDAIFHHWDDDELVATPGFNDSMNVTETLLQEGLRAGQEMGVKRRKSNILTGNEEDETRKDLLNVVQRLNWPVADRLRLELNAMFDLSQAVPGDPTFVMPSPTTCIATTEYEEIDVEALAA